MFVKNLHHLLAEACIQNKNMKNLASLKNNDKLIQSTYYLMDIDACFYSVSDLISAVE
jgi:hypothetical protein